MTDEAYLFKQDVREKAVTGRRMAGEGKPEAAQMIPAVGPADPKHTGDSIGANLILFENGS